MLVKRHPLFRKNIERISPDDRFRLLVESSLSGAYLIQDDLFRYVNSAFCRIFGYEAEEIVDKLGPIDLTARDDRELTARYIRERIEGRSPGIRYAFCGLKKDGTSVFVEVLGSVIRHEKHPAIIGTVVDNTELVLAGQALKESEDRYSRFFNEDIAARYVTTSDGTILSCNDTFIKLFSFSSKEEALKTNVACIYTNSRERDKFVELMKERKHLERREAEFIRKDGKKIYVLESATAELDYTGNLKCIRGYLIDETNKRQLEAQLFEAQRMESIGTLVSGIAHDLNNVLSIIIGQISIMDPVKVGTERLLKSRDAISKAARRGAHTIGQLLTFAHKVETITESVKVNNIVEEVVEFLEETFPEKIVFTAQLERRLPSIHADPNQLQQVLINLCVNARDAMPSGGTLTISTSRIDRKSLEGRFPDLSSDEYLVTKVSDNGVGIDHEDIGRIFEPFFTTKKNGYGTGLGLSVVYGIMKAHHGFIDVRSEVGRGTEFSLYFPIPIQIINAPLSALEKEIERGHGETILIVEDEEAVQDYMKETIERNGYRTLLAKDGIEAVKVFEEHRGDINAVVMDMGLPKMNGAQALLKLKLISPEVRVIFTSGYIEPDIKAAIFEAGAKEFIQKPFPGVDLLEKIQKVLVAQ
ncbi:MAG TPA: PAS domain S-box protein [Candidatus Acidoferrales bacterium]|nr:PAS domain S-box protein [Candidatus Acidoferrales bacterium]